MNDAIAPGRIDPRRRLLAIVLAAIAACLILGGAKLLSLSGSPYYLLAGLAVGASAWLVGKGDRRGAWIYLALLVATVLWAFFERGTNIWAFTARVFAPAILGIWVCWPLIRRHMAIGGGITALTIAGFGVAIANGGNVDAFGALGAADSSAARLADSNEWPHYGNSLAGTRFSTVSQITPQNVGELKPAWSYRTGSLDIGLGFEATPLMVNDTLYLCTPNSVIHALDPDSGKKKWVFDPKAEMPQSGTCRGVAYFKEGDGKQPCDERIIFGTVDARLMAVDANTGALCSGFGNAGTIDLRRGMGEVKKGYYYTTSAPTIVNGNIIIGGWVADNQYVGEPSGVIRAFDATTGKFAWAWDMDRPDQRGEPAEGETYSRSTPNSWGPMSGDEALGLVYLPTGNSTPDYWSRHRSEAGDRYASSVIALDARTGDLRWSFQTTHLDLWDYDVASQPTLVDLPVDGQTVPALIQPTKRGQVFVLDRRNGKPITKVEERAVPQGVMPGEQLSPTQPFSVGMPSFDDTVLSESQMWGATPLDQLWCRIKFREARYEGPFTPPRTTPSITYNSYLGGINWGSVAVDPERLVMIVNYNRMANYTRLVPRKESDAMGAKVSENGTIHIGLPVPQMGTPFGVSTGPFLSPLTMPCTEPPFGKIAAVDLKTRKLLWERALGSSADSGPKGIAVGLPLPMGVPNSGGSLFTRSGLVFIGATQEKAIRAIDAGTGKKLWSWRLPTSGHATPMTYVSPKTGKQYVVIAAGGSSTMMTQAGDHVMAFALPGK